MSSNKHLLVGTSPLNLAPYIMSEIRGRRVLDVGCGAGVYGYLLRNKWQDTFPGSRQFMDFVSRDVRNDQPALLVGCDIQTENIRRVTHHRIYDDVFLASADRLPLPDNYVDTVICVEVLEHLTAAQVQVAIGEFCRVATQRVVVTVPLHSVDEKTGRDERGFLFGLDESDNDVREWVEAETHKSSISSQQLREFGFDLGNSVNTRFPRSILTWLRREYNLRFGLFRGQILARMDLRKGEAICPPYSHRAPRTTEGIPDYR